MSKYMVAGERRFTFAIIADTHVTEAEATATKLEQALKRLAAL